VLPVRAFPVSEPGGGLALVSAEGRELAWIDHPDALSAAMRTLVEEALAAREFLPEIRRVRSVSGYATPSTWIVETDRGETTFVLRGEDDIRRMGPGRLLVADASGVQYLIRDLAALDRASRRLLDRFL
jgi:hypothetical protein